MSLSIQSYLRWHYLFTFGQYYRIYIYFWRFNSKIMTWNKWLVFTKSVIMGLNNISPWPCSLGVVCLPCVITWLYSTPLLFVQAVGVVVCLSLRMAYFSGSRRTHHSVLSGIFIADIVLYFLLSFSYNGQYIHFPFTLTLSYKLLFSI